jgi:outer membrane immunogenic protein
MTPIMCADRASNDLKETSMTKTKIIVALAAALIATPALSADLATKAPPPIAAAWSWAGWYAGVNLGYGFGDPAITDNSFALPTIVNALF